MQENLRKLKTEKHQTKDTTADTSTTEELNEEISRLKRKINIIIKDNEA